MPFTVREGVVECSQQSSWRTLAHRDRSQRVAREPGNRGGFGTFAAHVAEHQRPRAPTDLEDVVEVTPDLVTPARGPVARRKLDAGNRGQGRREQTRLQRPGNVVALGEQPRVVERESGPARELLGE